MMDLYHHLVSKDLALGEIVTSQPCLMGVRRQQLGCMGQSKVEKKHAGETWDSCSVSNLIGKAARVLESWTFIVHYCNDLHFVFLILDHLCIYFCTKILKWKYITILVLKNVSLLERYDRLWSNMICVLKEWKVFISYLNAFLSNV